MQKNVSVVVDVKDILALSVTTGAVGVATTLLFTFAYNTPAEVKLMMAALGLVGGYLFGFLVLAERLVQYKTGFVGGGVRTFAEDVAEKPAKVVYTVRIDRNENGIAYPSGSWFDLPDTIDFEKLREVSKRLVRNGFAFPYSAFCGSGGILDRYSEYEPLRSFFLEAGLLKWKHPRAHNLGTVATPDGVKFFTTLATRSEQGGISALQWLRKRMQTDADTEGEIFVSH